MICELFTNENGRIILIGNFTMSLLGCLFFLANTLFLILINFRISSLNQGLFFNLISLGESFFKGACLLTDPSSLL